MTAHIIFAVIALVCFVADAAGISFGRVNVQGLGLAFLTAAILFT
jgi:hypothetical protein